MKTNRSAAKRFRKRGSGSYKHDKAGGNHLMTRKGATRKRNLRKSAGVSKADRREVSRLVPR